MSYALALGDTLQINDDALGPKIVALSDIKTLFSGGTTLFVGATGSSYSTNNTAGSLGVFSVNATLCTLTKVFDTTNLFQIVIPAGTWELEGYLVVTNLAAIIGSNQTWSFYATVGGTGTANGTIVPNSSVNLFSGIGTLTSTSAVSILTTIYTCTASQTLTLCAVTTAAASNASTSQITQAALLATRIA